MKEFDFDKCGLIPVVDQFLYRKQITILAGGPYAGKSRLAIRLAFDLSQGKPCLLGQYNPLKVLYCSERDWDFNSAQIRTVIPDPKLPDNLRFFCVPDIPAKEFPLFEANPLVFIASKCIDDTWIPDLIELDTLPYFQSLSAQTDINSYGHNRRDLLRAKRWASTYNASVLALTHSPKQSQQNKYEDPFDRVIGSVSILAATVAASIIERMNENYCRIHFRSHVSCMETPRYFSYRDFCEVPAGLALADDVSSIIPMGKRQTEVLSLIPYEQTEFLVVLHSIAQKLESSDNNIRNLITDLHKKKQVEIIDNLDTDTRYIRRIKPQ